MTRKGNDLLQQIEDLSNAKQRSAPTPKSHADSSPKPPTFSEVVQWSEPKPKRHTNTSSPPKPTPTSNRFSLLLDETDNDAPTHTPPQRSQEPSTSTTSSTNSNSTRKKVKNSDKGPKSKPQIVLFGDSIGKRIVGHKLTRGAEVINKCDSDRDALILTVR